MYQSHSKVHHHNQASFNCAGKGKFLPYLKKNAFKNVIYLLESNFKKNYKKGGQTERIWRQTSVHMSFGGGQRVG